MRLKKSLCVGVAMMALVSFRPKGSEHAGAPVKNLLDRANMDTTVRPGDNFCLYANGTWLRNNPVPNSKTRWGSFNLLQEDNYKKMHGLLEAAADAKSAKPGSAEQKVGDFYRSGMDSIAIEKAGILPLKGEIERINSVSDANGLLAEIIKEHTEGRGVLFHFDVSPDDKNVTKQMCQFGQGGLGLPGREYYFDNDDRTVKVREAYKVYIEKMLGLMGDKDAKKDASDIFGLEMKLAEASLTRVQMRDPNLLYNKFDVAGIDLLTPGMEWKKVLTGLRAGGQDSVIVGMPKFFSLAAAELSITPLNTWKKYLQFNLLNGMAPYLSSAFDTTDFNFYSRTMHGQKEQEPRWKRVMAVVDHSEGDLLGQMYVAKYFKPEAKKRMMELVNNLQATYAERIKNIDWMSDATKQKGLTKLNAFMKKIGYTDKWKDYSALTIVSNSYVKNVMAARQWSYNFNLGKLGKPVDRTEWDMTPPTVNAYYNQSFNEIVFPAGILQFPFFDENADDAVNYGGIGAVIGHEMTHGFDDQGRQYAADGNLSNWWTSEDSANFTKKADKMVEEYNQITVIDTYHVNGRLTEGENLADLGGLNIAYEAFKKTKQGQSNEKIGGFTPDQRFFLSWAQVWRANTLPEELVMRIKTDPHSPSEVRCNTTPSNMEAWYKAFNVKPGDKMYRAPDQRARVW